MDNIDSMMPTLAMHFADDALLHSLLARQPWLRSDILRIADMLADSGPNLRNCPAWSDAAALAVTIFDNHKFGDTRGVRYGADIKVWQGPVNFKKPAQWKATAKLWPAKDAVKKARELQVNKKRPISDATVDGVQFVVDGGWPLVGIAKHNTPGEGTVYFEDHLIAANLVYGKITAVNLFTPGLSVQMPALVTTDPAGRALTDKAIMQTRHSDQDEMAAWSTGIGGNLKC